MLGIFVPIFIIVFTLILIALYERSVAARTLEHPHSDHFDGKHFFNPDMPVHPSAPSERKSPWIWLLTRSRGEWKRCDVIQVVPPERVHEGVRITYINHATVLLQFSGINIVTDPVWSYRVSPFPFMGPIRYAEPGVRFENLPPIDVVLLSHNHYDHMDILTLRKIYKKWAPRIYTGLGNAAYLARKGILGVHDMDWWDTHDHGPVKIVYTPAQHFSARSVTDRNVTLWGGFILETPHGNMYFAGDTGWGPRVHDIASRYASFAFAMLPIGAYNPAWMMQLVHTNPEEAIQMHDALHAVRSMGIHHGTFRLTDEPQSEPVERIVALRQERDFQTPENGGVITFE